MQNTLHSCQSRQFGSDPFTGEDGEGELHQSTQFQAVDMHVNTL